MWLNLGRRGDYSVRAMLDVARHWQQGRRKTRSIADTMDIPLKYLTQILADLVSHDCLDAQAGPAGGYTLSRPPGEITLLDVVIASEGPLTLDRCVLHGGPCDWVESCPVHDTWASAQTAFADRLAATTFAELVRVDEQIEAGTYEPGAPGHEVRTARAGQRQ